MDKRSIFLWGISVPLIAIFLFVTLQEDGLSESEKMALDFYQAVWIRGDVDTAQNMLESSSQRDLKYEAEVAKLRNWNTTTTLMIGSQEKGNGDYDIYIHRSDKNMGVSLQMTKVDGSWKVMAFDRNDPSHYNSLRRDNPEVKWKKIEL